MKSVSIRVNGKRKEFEITRKDWMESLTCPNCGATECHPQKEKMRMIRGYVVDDASHCLVCAGYFDENLNPVPKENRPENIDELGWF